MAPPPEEEQWQRIGSKIYHEKKYFVGLKWWNRSSHIRNTNAVLVKKRSGLIVFALQVSTDAMSALQNI